MRVKKWQIIPVVALAAAVTAGLAFAASQPGSGTGEFSIHYTDTNKKLQHLLVQDDIHMSSPIRLNGFSIEKYCTFFSDDMIQRSIQYCTSTELLDSDRNFLGNIQMVGSNQNPEYVIAAIEVDETLSQMDDLKVVASTVIETLVCTCWEEDTPGGFATIPDWIDAALEHHAEGQRTTSKSEVAGLDKRLLLEITTEPDATVWKLVIYG